MSKRNRVLKGSYTTSDNDYTIEQKQEVLLWIQKNGESSPQVLTTMSEVFNIMLALKEDRELSEKLESRGYQIFNEQTKHE